jgi:hypothetical protein
MATQLRPVEDRDDHPVAALLLSGIRFDIGFDEQGGEETVYIAVDGSERQFMTPCETHLLIAALGTALCQASGKDGE